MMTNKDVIVNEMKLHGYDVSVFNNYELFTEFCSLHNDNCDGCQFADKYCPIGIATNSRLERWWEFEFDNKPTLTYADYMKKLLEVEDINDK